ncbi:hypothetical protein [Lysobacter gummosus]
MPRQRPPMMRTLPVGESAPPGPRRDGPIGGQAGRVGNCSSGLSGGRC